MRRTLKFKQLHERYGGDRSPEAFRMFLWRAVREGRFPAPVKEGPHSVAWFEDEVEGHYAHLPRVTYAPADRRAA